MPNTPTPAPARAVPVAADVVEKMAEALRLVIFDLKSLTGLLSANAIQESLDALVTYDAACAAVPVSTGTDTSYPIRECLIILSDFALRRLKDFDYDGDGWEVLQSAAEHAQRYLNQEEEVSGLITLNEHVDEWVYGIPKTDDERKAKKWLSAFRTAAMLRDDEYLDSRVVSCTYEGSRYRVIGASRLGDIWLTADMNANKGYQLRVDATKCSDWKVNQAVLAELARIEGEGDDG